MSDTKHEDLMKIGKSAYASIVEMVAALECDYDRLEELRDIETEVERDPDARMDEDHREELKELEDAAGECEDREEAEQRIQEDALSIQVRSGWANIGDALNASEFEIMLTTGGPAVRIMGELDGNAEPDRAWLEVQDWGTPWTQYIPADQDTLLTYCRCFYFGE